MKNLKITLTIPPDVRNDLDTLAAAHGLEHANRLLTTVAVEFQKVHVRKLNLWHALARIAETTTETTPTIETPQKFLEGDIAR